MGTVIEIRGKTEQRVERIIKVLKSNDHAPLTYVDLEKRTGAPYDVLLYVLTTLVEVGLVERIEPPEEGRSPGRPKVSFRWAKHPAARAMGAR